MKLMIIGSKGQLGSDLVACADKHDVIALNHEDIEIEDIESVNQAVSKYKPDAIINTAAYVRVDDCESDRDAAFRTNAIGSRNVAVAADRIRAKLVFISSDYVFGADSEHRSTPFQEYETPSPVNQFGWSKVAGESYVRNHVQRHFIVRVSGLFGISGSTSKGGNFVETIIKLGQSQNNLRVVNDQMLSPTYSVDASNIIIDLLGSDLYGTYHVTNSGSCSWWEFASEILRQSNITSTIEPISSWQYPQAAKRPAYSVLDNYHLALNGWSSLRPWKEALSAYLRQRKESIQ